MSEPRINIRASKELKKMVQELAEADNRDVTSWITNHIKKEYSKLKANQ